MYVYKATIGHNFDGTPIRKAFYSKTSKEDAKAKANQYIIDKRLPIEPEKIQNPNLLHLRHGQINGLKLISMVLLKITHI